MCCHQRCMAKAGNQNKEPDVDGFSTLPARRCVTRIHPLATNRRLSTIRASAPLIAITVDSLYRGIFLQSPQAHTITLLWGEIAKYQVFLQWRSPHGYTRRSPHGALKLVKQSNHSWSYTSYNNPFTIRFRVSP